MVKLFIIRFCSFAIYRGKFLYLCIDGWNVFVIEIANFIDFFFCDIINKFLYFVFVNLIFYKYNFIIFELIYKYEIGFLKLL